MFDMNNKIALVTGATGGIGASIATAIHKQGGTVVLSGTREEKLKELESQLGHHAHICPCNLSDDEAVDGLIAKAEELAGPIDVLVNNAGITRDGLFMRMKDEDWNDVLHVNLNAVFRLSRSVLRGMMKRKFGRIINISSVVGVTGNPGQANYVTAKAGVIGMTKSLAQEVASRGITVNAIAPGFIETAMTDVLNDTQKEGILTKVPAGRLGTGEEVAAAALYLASDEAAYVTGQTLHVNGGMAMI